MRKLLIPVVLLALVPSAVQARKVRFTLPPEGSHTQVVGRHAPDFHLRYVRVNERSLIFGWQGSSDCFMYGVGVALRFYQHGNTHYVRAVSAAVHPRRVEFSFRLSG